MRAALFILLTISISNAQALSCMTPNLDKEILLTEDIISAKVLKVVSEQKIENPGDWGAEIEVKAQVEVLEIFKGKERKIDIATFSNKVSRGEKYLLFNTSAFSSGCSISRSTRLEDADYLIEAINGIYKNEEVKRLKEGCLRNNIDSIMGEIINVYPRINLKDCQSDGDNLTINLTGNFSTKNANYFYSFPLTYTLSASRLNWDGVGVKSEIEMKENIEAIEESQLVRGFFQTEPNPENIYKVNNKKYDEYQSKSEKVYVEYADSNSDDSIRQDLHFKVDLLKREYLQDFDRTSCIPWASVRETTAPYITYKVLSRVKGLVEGTDSRNLIVCSHGGWSYYPIIIYPRDNPESGLQVNVFKENDEAYYSYKEGDICSRYLMCSSLTSINFGTPAFNETEAIRIPELDSVNRAENH